MGLWSLAEHKLDFSDKLSTPSFADEDSQKLLEELLKGENE